MAYFPERPPEPETDREKLILDYIFRELDRINVALRTLNLDQTFVAPTKPQDGDVRYADGTSWNPGGTGKGMYMFEGAAWVKIG